MDKSLFIFIVIGLGALYFVTHIVHDIQAEDNAYYSGEYKLKHKYDQYQKVDSVGRSILAVEGTDATIQEAAWNISETKVEFFELFPNYTEMKKFVKERVRGDMIQRKLLQTLDIVEGKFISGTLDVEQAKDALNSLK